MKGIKYTAKEKQKALKMWLEEGEDILRVAKKFKCSERVLWRWKAAYDGTLESLENKSSRPHTPHPNSHTAEEKEQIMGLFGANPNMGYAELFGELRAQFAYKRHFMSMYNFIRKNCLRPVVVYSGYIPKEYETPEMLGIKMQMDVKYVPRECFEGQAKKDYERIGQKYYQYTMIDAATRARVIFPYKEHSGYSTKDFIKRALIYFGYLPAEIQTDNGTEFTNPKGTGEGKVHAADRVMNELQIHHRLIRPYTPRHNGKVERSHRNDQEKFYRFLTFETYEELRDKMATWLTRSNNIPSSALRNREGKRVWQTPLQKRVELLEILKEQGGVAKMKDHNQNDKEIEVKIRFLKKSTRDKAA